MWICTPFGILMPAVRPAKHIPEGDNRTMQVRARQREYLDLFRKHYCPELGESINFPNQDYQWKAYCTPEQLAAAMGKLMLAIDFEKFKPETFNPRWGLSTALRGELHSCYNSMWTTQLRYTTDGTSKYDHGWTTSYNPATYVPRPSLCRREGHWYPRQNTNNCVDCGHQVDCKKCAQCGGRSRRPAKDAPFIEAFRAEKDGKPVAPWLFRELPAGSAQPADPPQPKRTTVKPAKPAGGTPVPMASGWPLTSNITTQPWKPTNAPPQATGKPATVVHDDVEMGQCEWCQDDIERQGPHDLWLSQLSGDDWCNQAPAGYHEPATVAGAEAV
jgi:hypothetical protein